MIKIPAIDPEGRYLEPFLSFVVMNMSHTTETLKNEWGAEFIDGVYPGSAAYVEFEDEEMATAFTLRWSGAALAD